MFLRVADPSNNAVKPFAYARSNVQHSAPFAHGFAIVPQTALHAGRRLAWR